MEGNWGFVDISDWKSRVRSVCALCVLMCARVLVCTFVCVWVRVSGVECTRRSKLVNSGIFSFLANTHTHLDLMRCLCNRDHTVILLRPICKRKSHQPEHHFLNHRAASAAAERI